MVEPGTIAICHYTGRLVDGDEVGEPFDTTDVDRAMEAGIYHDNRDYKPVQIRVGESEVVPGVDRMLRDLESDPDELPVETTARLEPEDAFGEHDESLVVEIPLTEIDTTDGSLEPEMPVETDDGRTGWITAVDGDTATVDFNHELAGIPVEIELTLLEVREERTKSG